MSTNAPALAAEGVATPLSSFGLPAAWWPVAFSASVTVKPRAVRLGNRELVLFRTQPGDVHAVDDLCPHRRLPLSMGRVTKDGELQCGYHGWCFDGETGRCTRIPNLRQDERPSPRLKVPAFLTGETNHRRPIATESADPDDPQMTMALALFGTAVVDGFVFVWSGDPAESDPAPARHRHEDVSGSGGEPTPSLRGAFLARVPYRRAAEALLVNPGRALHLGWLLGSGEEMSGPEAERGDSAVVACRERLVVARARAATFDPVITRTARVRIEARTDSGLTRIATEGRPDALGADLTVGLTPVGPYRTAVHWHGRLTGGPGRVATVAARGLAATVRVVGRLPNALEQLADDAELLSDPALDLFRNTEPPRRSP